MAEPQRWFHGPAADLLFGCGVAYMAVFAVLLVAGPQVQALVPLGLLTMGTLFIGAPHYGATLLRVYGSPLERQRYALFAVHGSAAIAVLFVLGLYLPLLGSALLTLYLTWSPWHYAGQNYGISLAFLRRRGVPFSDRTRRLLQASFWLSFALTFLAVHESGSAFGGYAPPTGETGEITFLALGIPPVAAVSVGMGVLAAYLLCLAGAAAGLLRRASPGALLPVALLVASQALWFTVPVAVRAGPWLSGLLPFAPARSEYAFVYVVFAHSVQYLWITSYYARADRGEGTARHLVWAFLAGSAIWGVPALLFAPRLLGPRPFDAGLFLMIASAVNLHHFVLDGAIWKLRDGAIARVLLRPASAAPGPAASSARWAAPLVAVLGVVCAGVFLVDSLEREFGVRRALARGDVERVERASRRLWAIGRESAAPPLNAGLLLAERGELERARAHIRESLAVQATATAHTALGQVEARAGDLEAASASLDAALALDPLQLTALRQAAQVWLARGEPERAVPYLERARAVARGALARDVERTLAAARRSER